MKRQILPMAALALALVGATSGVQAEPILYEAFLDGPSESPPNASPGTGFSMATIDVAAHTLRVQVMFQGLSGTTTASHIHSATAAPGTGTAIVATTTPTFAGFPLGVSSGTYDSTLDLTLASSYNPAFITANGGTVATAEAALAAGLAEGKAYLNIHTNLFPSGEIRGFYQLVPEPAAAVALGIGGLLLARSGWPAVAAVGTYPPLPPESPELAPFDFGGQSRSSGQRAGVGDIGAGDPMSAARPVDDPGDRPRQHQDLRGCPGTAPESTQPVVGYAIAYHLPDRHRWYAIAYPTTGCVEIARGSRIASHRRTARRHRRRAGRGPGRRRRR